MATIFLISLYLSFAGMGLYSSMFGQVWPVAQLDFGINGSYGAFVSIGITGGTIIGSLLGAWVQRKIGSGKTTFLAVLLLAVCCFSISLVPAFVLFVLLSVPIGIMGGLLDVTINNYIAQNLKPQFMSWLHAIWGIGSFAATHIAAYFLKNNQWRGSYRTISYIQLAIAGLMFFMIPQWTKQQVSKEKPVGEEEQLEPRGAPRGKEPLLEIKGLAPLLIAVFFYGGAENAFNYWGATYLVDYYHVLPEIASRWMSFYFAGIMISRILAGFIAMKVNYKTIVGASELLMIFSGVLLLLPFGTRTLIPGIFLFGFGCGPIAPGKLHLAPKRFGHERAQQVIGLQTASLFAGGMVIPPIVGFVGNKISMLFLPIMIIVGSIVLWMNTKRVDYITQGN